MRERGGDDLSEDEYRFVPAERRDRETGCDRRDREHGCVVGHPDRRPVLEQLHDRRGEADDHAGLPAVEDDARRAEDEAERDAAGIDPVERDRIALGQRGGCEQAGDPRERHRIAGGHGERDRGRRGDREAQQTHRQNDHREPRGHLDPELTGRALPAPGEKFPTPVSQSDRKTHDGDDHSRKSSVLPLQHVFSLLHRKTWTPEQTGDSEPPAN